MPSAFITGGAKRIGRAIALALAGRGWDIALHYLTSESDAQQTAGEIRALGRRCELFPADLADMTQVRELMGQVLSAFPDCNLLVNNASIFARVNFMQTDEPHFDRNFAINFKAPVFLTQDFARNCRQGQVINVLDTKISRPSVNYFAYAMSKRALADFTLSAARELAPTIRVNGICPGMTLAPADKGSDYLERLSTAVPLKRPGNPGQIASAVLFLLDNDYVTGQILFIDGGEHIGDDIRVE